MPHDEEATIKDPGFEGMDAKERGEPVEACPYQPGPQRTAWVVGWYIATRRDVEKPHAE